MGDSSNIRKKNPTLALSKSGWERGGGNRNRFAFSALQKTVVATSACTGGTRCPLHICILHGSIPIQMSE